MRAPENGTRFSDHVLPPDFIFPDVFLVFLVFFVSSFVLDVFSRENNCKIFAKFLAE